MKGDAPTGWRQQIVDGLVLKTHRLSVANDCDRRITVIVRHAFMKTRFVCWLIPFLSPFLTEVFAQVPVITNQPVDRVVTQGDYLYFTVGASNATSYQWQLNGTNISGATLSTLVADNAQPSNAGTYSVIVGNSSGNVTSSNAVLTVIAGTGSTNHVVSYADEYALRSAVRRGGYVSFDVDGNIRLSQSLAILTNVTINGSNRVVSLDGGNAVRIMGIPTGVTCNLLNVSLVNGRAIGAFAGAIGNGGAIDCRGTLTAVNCVFSNNVAKGADGRGGNGNPVVAGASGFGGAIYNLGRVNVTNASFLENSAFGGAGLLNVWGTNPSGAAFGGAIYNFGGTLVLNGAVFETNTICSGGVGYRYGGPIASSYGGAVFSSGGTLEIADSAFNGNFARAASTLALGGVETNWPGSSYGGALCVSNVTAVVTNSTFVGNICSGSCYRTADVSLTAPGYGGAVFNSAELSVQNCRFVANLAGGGRGTDANSGPIYYGGNGSDGYGGGVYNCGSLVVTNSCFIENRASGGLGGLDDVQFIGVGGILGYRFMEKPGFGYGGAIANSGAVSLATTIVSNNVAWGGPSTSCGAVFGSSNIVFANCTIISNFVTVVRALEHSYFQYGQSGFFEVVGEDLPDSGYSWDFVRTIDNTNSSLPHIDLTNALAGSSRFYTQTNLQVTNCGYYCATFTNDFEKSVQIEITVPPLIVKQPSVTHSVGYTFSLNVIGIPVYFQWQVNGTNIVGATNYSYHLSDNLTTFDLGNHTVIVSNSAGLVTSDPVLLAVKPSIVSQTLSSTVLEGTNVTLSVNAFGTAPMSYTWFHDGLEIIGQTGTSLTLNNVQASDAGPYQVSVTNVVGVTMSTNIVLTVIAPVSITQQPESRMAAVGENVTLSVATLGHNPVYRWRRNGAFIAGATNASLVLNNVQLTNSATYSVLITNSLSSVTSSNATLVVIAPPTIQNQTGDLAVGAGTNASFSVTVTGSAASFLWSRDGSPLSYATNAVLNIPHSQPSDSGVYSVIVSNFAGVALSSNMVLTVVVKPQVTVQPSSLTVVAGTNVQFAPEVSGSAATYQWKFNNQKIASGTDVLLNLTNVQAADSGLYSLVASNLAGSVVSSNAVLTVIVAPTIVGQPQSKTVGEGTNISLSVTTTGSAADYQWFYNGNALAGATNSSLELPGIQLSQSGAYSVSASNLAGVAMSSNAMVTVLALPTITSQPASQTVAVGSAASFAVSVANLDAIKFQWKFNGTNLARQTNATPTLTNVRRANAGTYQVVLRNVAGTVTSSPAKLKVLTPVAITRPPRSMVVHSNATVTFNVGATGSALRYQWQFEESDLNNATNASLVVSNVSGANAGVYGVKVENDASITNVSATLGVTPSAFDFNGDGQTDLLLRNGSSGQFTVWLMNKTNVAKSLLLGSAINRNWRFAGLGNLTGNSQKDIVLQYTNGAVAVASITGTNLGTIVSIDGDLSGPGNVGSEWMIRDILDLNSDGKADLLAQGADGNVGVWLLDGTNFTSGSPIILGTNMPTGWSIVGAGDFNNDGSSDIVWQSNQGQMYVWLMDGTNFVEGAYLLAGKPTASTTKLVSIEEFNADGRPDLIFESNTGVLSIKFLNGMELQSQGLLKGGVPINPALRIVSPR